MAVRTAAWRLFVEDAGSPAMIRFAAASDRAAVAAGRAEKATAKSASGISKSMKLMGAGLAAFGVADLFGHAISDASQYNAVLNKVATNTGLTTAKMNQFSKSFMSISNRSAQPVADIATGFGELYAALTKLGDKPKQILGVLDASAKAATASGTDLGTELNAVVSEMTAFKTPASQVNTVLGQMIATVGQGNMNMQDLSESLAGLPAYAAAAGVQLKDVNAMLAEFGDMGIKGATAGTKVRMIIQDLIQPSVHADAALKPLHLSVKALFDSLRDKGAVATIQLLADRFKAAGIQGTALEKVLLDTFTKKGGAGIAQMVTHADQLTETIHRVVGGVDKLGQSEQQTFGTAAVQFKRFGNAVGNFMIQLGEKLIPVVTSAAKWLGDNLPKAIHALSTILSPLIHAIGTGLATAWHIALAVLKPVGSALAAVGRWLGRNTQLVKGFGIAVLGMWAAFKGAAIATAAFTAIGTELSLLRTRIGLAGLAIQGMARQSLTAAGAMKAAFGGLAIGATIGTMTANASGLAKALGAIGSAAAGAAIGLQTGGAWGAALGGAAGLIGDLLGLTTQMSEADQKWKSETDDLTAAIVQNNGALDKQIRTKIATAIQDSGVIATARKVGVSTAQVTRAALDQGDALGRLNRIMGQGVLSGKLTQKQYDDTYDKLRRLATEAIPNAEARGKALAIINAAVNKSYHDVGNGADQAKGPLEGLNTTYNRQAIAALKVADSVKKLNSAFQAMIDKELAAKDAQLGFREALLTMKSQLDNGSKSLANNTATGVANRKMLVDMAQQASEAAHQTADASHGTVTYTQALRDNMTNLIAHAKDLGLNSTKVHELFDALHLLPKDIPINVHADNLGPITTQFDALQHRIDKIQGDHVVSFTVFTKMGPVTALAKGGSVPDGVSVVGEQGRELLVKRGNTVDVLPNSKYRELMTSKKGDLGMVPHFAKGTADAVGRTKSWLHQQNPKRYDWGAAGPDAWDCSGLVGGAIKEYLGQDPNGRIFSTSNEAAVLPGMGFKHGAGNGNGLVVGWNSHHTTGMINGLKFEAFGDNGVPLDRQVRVGPTAFDPRKFPNVMHLDLGLHGQDIKPGGDPKMTGPTPKQQRRKEHRQALNQARYSFESSQHPHKILMRGGHAYFGGQEYDTRALAVEAKREAAVTGASNRAAALLAHQKTVAGNLASRLSGIGGEGVTDVGVVKIRKQLAAAADKIRDRLKSGDITKGMADKLRDQLHDVRHHMQKELDRLQLHIKKHDLTAITKAVEAGPGAMRDAVKQMLADAQKAGWSPDRIDAFQKRADRLLSMERDLTRDKAKLARMQSYGSSVRSTLAGAFDPTQYGSIQDLSFGLKSATGTNTLFKREVNSLRKRAKGNPALLRFINQLEQSGQTTTLQTLFHASAGQLNRIASQVSKYDRSLTGASNAAVHSKFGTTIGAEAKDIRDLRHDMNRLIGHMAHRPVKVEVSIDGDKVATKVVESPQFDHEVEERVTDWAKEIRDRYEYNHRKR